jgi:hypothetical protein
MYSPGATNLAPATRPATPNDDDLTPWRPRGCDAHDKAGRRHDAVVGSPASSPKPSDTFRTVTMTQARWFSSGMSDIRTEVLAPS